MIESGFTPAALPLLATAIGAQAGRGAAMGIYSVPLSVGAIIGSLIAAALGKRFAVDGLIYGTLAMAVIALLFVRRLDAERSIVASFGCGLRIKLGVGSPILYMLRCESAKYTVGIDSRRQAAL